MSQSGIINTSSGPVPPSVATSYVTDNGTAVPSANVLEVVAIDVTDNNANGILVEGGLVETGASNRVQVQLSNRITGTATTTDGVTPVTLYTFPLGATPGTYLFTQSVVGFNSTDQIGAVYSGFRGVRTTGAAGVLINTNIALVGEEGSFTVAEVANSISGNDAVLTVTGVAGKTIDWNVVTTYVFVG